MNRDTCFGARFNCFRIISLDRPWAKCGLFAAAALWPVFCGLTVALSLRNFCNEGLQNSCQHLPRRAPHADMSDSVKQIENNDSFSPGIHCNIIRQMMKSPISVYALLEKYSLGFYDQNTHVCLSKTPFLDNNNNISCKMHCSCLEM